MSINTDEHSSSMYIVRPYQEDLVYSPVDILKIPIERLSQNSSSLPSQRQVRLGVVNNNPRSPNLGCKSDIGLDISVDHLITIFKNLDLDKDGRVGSEEFTTGLRMMGGTPMDDREIADLFGDFCKTEEKWFNLETFLLTFSNTRTGRLRWFTGFIRKVIEMRQHYKCHRSIYISFIESQVESLKAQLTKVFLSHLRIKSESMQKQSELERQILSLQDQLEELRLQNRSSRREKLDEFQVSAENERNKYRSRSQASSPSGYGTLHQIDKHRGTFSSPSNKGLSTPTSYQVPSASTTPSINAKSPKSQPSSKYEKYAFWKRQKMGTGKSGKKKCATFWKFKVRDGSEHTVRLVHTQRLDENGQSKRIIRIDGVDNYNEVSSAKIFKFVLAADTIVISLEEGENNTWEYYMTINDQSFEDAQENYIRNRV